MKPKTKEALELIVEKGLKINEFGFADHARETGFAWRVKGQEDGTYIVEFDIPDEEKRDAFLLTYRLFYQKNENISFDNLSKLAKDPGLSKEWVDEALKLQKIFNDYLNSHSDYSVNLFDGQPTRREMLQAGLYGGLAHANIPKLVAQYRNWTKDDIREFVFQQEFSVILVFMIGLIDRLSEISQRELDK